MEQKSPCISVIVAVYNCEQWLRRCLDSLLRQTFGSFEIIAVDDCSTDASGQICDEYAARDKRVKVIHQEKNMGVAVARQTGLDNARGEYTIHCDPDDWVEKDMLGELYSEARRSNAGIVFCDYFWDRPEKKMTVRQKPCESNSDTLLGLVNGSLHGSTWNKLIRRELYGKYGIRFVPGMSYLEDLYVICSFMLHEELKVAYVPKAFYHYVIRPDSISSRFQRGQVDSMARFLKAFEDKADNPEYKEGIRRRKIGCKMAMWNTQSYSSKEIINRFREVNKDIIRNFLHKENGKRLANANGLVLTLLHLHPLAVLLHKIHTNVPSGLQ